jgi:hypothetical protein
LFPRLFMAPYRRSCSGITEAWSILLSTSTVCGKHTDPAMMRVSRSSIRVASGVLKNGHHYVSPVEPGAPARGSPGHVDGAAVSGKDQRCHAGQRGSDHRGNQKARSGAPGVLDRRRRHALPGMGQARQPRRGPPLHGDGTKYPGNLGGSAPRSITVVAAASRFRSRCQG